MRRCAETGSDQHATAACDRQLEERRPMYTADRERHPLAPNYLLFRFTPTEAQELPSARLDCPMTSTDEDPTNTKTNRPRQTEDLKS